MPPKPCIGCEYLRAQLHAVQEELQQVKAVSYNYADFTPTCKEDGICFICDEYLHGDNHADDCLATLFHRVIKDGDKASMVWLEVLDAKEAAEKILEEVAWFVEEHYKDGVCLMCGDWQSGEPMEHHHCSIGVLDRILCLK